ncbi:Roundabout homolog 1 [Eumeta japonica]|uniref:Roundabout homolog 1 n=1 Tax=Eumeta variegata TaxID=151549 RepID=A0A4C1T3B7_EUMVA|nr:Roundabout homolog 1 [Eumeta japonica]
MNVGVKTQSTDNDPNARINKRHSNDAPSQEVTSLFSAQNRAPRIKEHPSNTVAGRSEPATLRCVVEGRPKPAVYWYKDGTPLPPAEDGHRVLLEDGLLFLRVNRGKKDSDEGTYWCVAKNNLGEVASKNVTLAVAVIRDEFRIEPHDIQVAAGESAVLECQAPRGVPEPSVHWVKDGQNLDIEVNGRVTVTESGSLKILETLPTDSGVYRCVATNIAGERQSRAAALIIQRRPHFLVKPNNVTVLIGQKVELNCQSSDPNVKLTWIRDSGSLPATSIIDRGALKFDAVEVTDAGVYSCQIDSHTGTNTATAILTVYSLPEFTVVPENQTVWEGDSITIRCEAKGVPSPIIVWITEGTQHSLVFSECGHDDSKNKSAGQLLKNSSGSVIEYELIHARRYLQQDVLVLKRVDVTSSTTIKVVWDVKTDYNEYLEGVKIWYNGTFLNWKNSTDTALTLTNDGNCIVNGSLTTIYNSGSSSHLLTGLSPYTHYDIFLMPFYKLLLGKPSNLMSGVTEEDVPSEPPQNVTAGVINATAAWIRWEPPPALSWNGELTGYLIEIRTGGGRVVGQMSLGPRTLAAAASSLRAGGRYSARAAALTRRGAGPFSAPAQIHLTATHAPRHYVQPEPPQDSAASQMFPETWLLALGLTLFSVTVIAVFIFFYVKRRHGAQRKKSTGSAIVTAQQCLLNKETIWLRDKPTFGTVNDSGVDVINCHQSLLHGGHATSVLSVEPEYSLPQNSIQDLKVSSVDRLRRRPPEPYASNAIYTELNFKDEKTFDDCTERCSGHNNSTIHSCDGSVHYSSGECSTCCRSSISSRSTKDYREPNKAISVPARDNECHSCHTSRSGSRSRQDASRVCPNASDIEYDYPQWHWLGKENSFKTSNQAVNRASTGRSDQGCQINLCDILPPPPYRIVIATRGAKSGVLRADTRPFKGLPQTLRLREGVPSVGCKSGCLSCTMRARYQDRRASVSHEDL